VIIPNTLSFNEMVFTHQEPSHTLASVQNNITQFDVFTRAVGQNNNNVDAIAETCLTDMEINAICQK